MSCTAEELPGLAWHAERMAAMRARVGDAPAVTWTAADSEAAEVRRIEAKDEADRKVDAELGAEGSAILVGCSRTKLDHEAPARELYSSPLFRKARELAERSGQPWAILSAKHGLVAPDQMLEPYDLALGQLRAEDRRCWAARVNRQLAARFRGRARFIVFAGSLYLPALDGLEYHDPLAQMPVGERLRELNSMLAEGGAA